MSLVGVFILAMTIWFASGAIISGLDGAKGWATVCFLAGMFCAGFVAMLYVAPMVMPHLFRITQP